MPTISLLKILTEAMEKHGADGLFHEDGPCGCGIDDLSPGGCINEECVLAKSHKIEADELGEYGDYADVGDIVWMPIQIKAAQAQVQASGGQEVGK